MLEIQHLTKTYSTGVKAMDNITLSIPRGMFGLLGPNGAGKSTLMRTIATLQLPDSGTITFNGGTVDKKQLGFLPQEFGVYPGISAYDLLQHIAILKGIHNKGERRAQILSLLELTNLYNVRRKAVSTYSGGMKQRFGIAQALLGNPQLIIADEPTAGLDPEERNRFHNLLGEIGEQVVVILSTHIVEDVKELCPRMAILGHGKVIQEGVPDELIASLKGKVWKKTIAKIELPVYEKAYPVITARMVSGRTLLHVYADDDPGEGFSPAAASLEDVYFSERYGYAKTAIPC
ncbi:ATP-binding cassette domain-containing protein [Chitinophaga sp. SYP-B3965]|uniref:ABC transporter ATP-binding protein n=1 Tax=Chitinophaga sp. SYP-B3965 TaxID=2663120 RepID=UPI001299914A|nr:ABC transporter ATP-binding protein [Chitinophaga sp. SYP-B3965]MRG44827.1 ATP-binding cassette domain-containing protein [Chitinophaga sp. SYP-B3965]